LQRAFHVKRKALFSISFAPTAAGLLAAIVSGGCSDESPGRHAVSGSVKVDGAPLASGNISFQPVEGQATSGGAVVLGGRYLVPRGGGLAEGKYRVAINAPDANVSSPTDASALPGEPPPKPKEHIPPQWNAASDHFIEVRKQGPFVFEFEVSTNAK
jgi:hypothetical protein